MKKNTPFLLIALLSISALSHSMDEQYKKAKLEPQAAAAAAGAGAGVAHAKNAPIITGLLELATSLLPTVKLPDNAPVSKAQLIEVAEQGKEALKNLHDHSEFTRTYIKDADALLASLITLRPQAESLWDRSAQFMMHAEDVPSAVTFAQKLEAAAQVWKNSQKDPNDTLAQALAAQAKKFEDERERREKEHKAFIERLLKKQEQLFEAFFVKAKADAESATK